ncbi:MAG: sodium/proton-translocating pyrophosphatase, partial [Dehalococcoidia bacterium]
LLSYILIQDGWYWAAGCILLGLGGSVALHYIVRAYLGASGRAARFVGEAAEVGAVPSLLAGSSVGLEAAGATVLTLAVVVGGSALGGMEAAPAGIHTASGAALGVALAAVGMLMSNPYRGCLAGLDAATGPRPDRAGPRGDGPGESTGTGDPPEGSLPPTSRIHSALTATMVVAVLLAGFGTALRGEFDSLAYEHPERAVRLSQDAGTTRPGLDVLAEIVNALSGYRDDLESCGLDIATVRGLLVKDPIETAASLAAAPGDDGGRVCAAAENGSPLPLPQLLSIGPGRPEVLVGVLLGVLLALVIGALVLRTVWDTSGRLAGEIRRQSGAGRTLPDGEIAPATDEVARLAAGAALRASLRPGLVLVFLLVGGGAAMRFAPGTAGNGGWLAVEGLLAGLLLSNLLVGAVSVFTGAVRSAEGASDWGTALARPNRDSELPVIFRSPYITALGPAVHSAATLASLAALVLIPLFIG